MIRNNYFHDVVCGIYQNMGGPSQPVFYGSSTLTCGGTTTATFVANLAHGLLTKSGVIVRGAIVNSSVNNPFNGFPDNPGGYFEVESVPPMPADANGRPTSFTYKMSAVPAADATPGSATYAEFWRIRRLVVENGYATFEPTDRVAFVANPSFDASTLEIWAPLATGGCIVIITPAVLLTPARRERRPRIQRRGRFAFDRDVSP